MYFTILVLLFIYCCIINYNQLCSWKQHSFISSLQVRSLAWHCWVLCWGYYMAKIKMSVKLSSPGGSKKKFSFKLIVVIFKLQFIAVFGLRSCVLFGVIWWLLSASRNHPHFLLCGHPSCDLQQCIEIILCFGALSSCLFFLGYM